MDRMAHRGGQHRCLCVPLVLGGARVLNDRKSVVDSAAGQLAAFRRRAEDAPGNEELATVLHRSRSIYTQAVDNYNRALSRPWVYLPARLMGFRKASAGSSSASQDNANATNTI